MTGWAKVVQETRENRFRCLDEGGGNSATLRNFQKFSLSSLRYE